MEDLEDSNLVGADENGLIFSLNEILGDQSESSDGSSTSSSSNSEIQPSVRSPQRRETLRYYLRRLARDTEAPQAADSNSLQSLLSSIATSSFGQVRSNVFGYSSSDSGGGGDKERLHLKPTEEQLKRMKESDFGVLTQRNLGLKISCQCLPKVIAQREVGSCGNYRNFSPAQTCQISERFIPNTHKLMGRFKQKLFCGTYSVDGDIFISVCQDQYLRVFDTSSGQFNQINSIRARNVGWSVLDTVLSPDKRHIVYSSWCDAIHQVDVTSDECDSNHQTLPLVVTNNDRFCIFSLRFSQDGDEILCGSNDGCIFLYDRLANVQSMKIAAHGDDVNAVAFVDEATHVVASGGDDGLCKIWDRRSLRESHPVPVGCLAGHLDGITYIDPRGDGRYLITNSKDQTIKLWDLRKFSSNKAIEETQKAVSEQSWDYRWQNVPGHLKRQNPISEDSSVMTYSGHSVLQTLIRCRFSPEFSTAQKFIYTGSASGSVYIYDMLTGKIARELRGHRSCVRDVSWHPYLPEIMSSSWDFLLFKWIYTEDTGDQFDRKSKTANSQLFNNGKKRRKMLQGRSQSSEEDSY